MTDNQFRTLDIFKKKNCEDQVSVQIVITIQTIEYFQYAREAVEKKIGRLFLGNSISVDRIELNFPSLC